MKIRAFNLDDDFDVIKTWITDERIHMMWCANLIPYPLEKEKFRSFLSEIAGRFGDSPFVAVNDEGRVVGFYCYSLNHETHEGMLKFVMVDASELPLAKFRKYYHSVLTTEEKKILIDMGMDPWSIEGLKYAGDCRRYKIKLGNKIDN